jgi:hypothetical protein
MLRSQRVLNAKANILSKSASLVIRLCKTSLDYEFVPARKDAAHSACDSQMHESAYIGATGATLCTCKSAKAGEMKSGATARARLRYR